MINAWVKAYLRSRLPRMMQAMNRPEETQRKVLYHLLRQAAFTTFGKAHGFARMNTYAHFSNEVSYSTYEAFRPWIDRCLNGEEQVVWPSPIRWFAKSSGTTDDRSKYVPVTNESLKECHYRAGRDILSFYTKNHPDHRLFTGKSLVLTGSTQPTGLGKMRTGDISGVLIENLSPWIHYFRTPAKPLALIPDWDEKIDRFLSVVPKENVTFISGVPSWMQVLLSQMMQQKGTRDLHDIWPSLELFIHGAVNFEPYRAQFSSFFPKNNIRYYETYNASEGFFALQDRPESGEMLLMTDYGIFYEFIEMDGNSLSNRILPLWETEVGKNYALLISTNAGLWRYLIGDTITFTSTQPYRIRITGRTKHFINAFGEELMVDNAEKALAHAMQQTGAAIRDYTVAPIYLKENGAGSHEWIIEFTKNPGSLDQFIQALDGKLREINSDYDAKRRGNLTMDAPVVRSVPEDTFYKWLKSRGRLGGQHKVPRLYNDRRYVEEIMQLVNHHE